MGEKVFKLVGMAAAMAAGIAAKQVATRGWKLVMNDDPPANPEDPETQMWEAVTWALASGAAIALARLVATRKWTAYVAKSTGQVPASANSVS